MEYNLIPSSKLLQSDRHILVLYYLASTMVNQYKSKPIHKDKATTHTKKE